MKSILFFQTNFEIGFGKFATYWLPYAVAKIWSYASSFTDIKETWEVTDYIFQRMSPEQLIAQYGQNPPDLIAFSSYIWNWNHNLQVIKVFKQAWPHVKVVMGGPQVTSTPDRAAQLLQEHPGIDYLVHGEGELAFLSILRFENGDAKLAAGITTRDNISDCSTQRISHLDQLPSPFLNGVMDSIISKYPGMNFSVTLETNRGCPYQCTFCDWGGLTFNKIKRFPDDIVKQEVDWISNNSIKFVDVADANFGFFHDADFSLLRHMMTRKKETGFPEAYSFNWQKNAADRTLEMVKYLTENNSARGFTLSMQSMDTEVLKNIKRGNMEISNFSTLIQKCNTDNIQTYTELILGLPGETKETWIDGTLRLLEAGQHNNIEVWLCQMLENAELNSVESITTHGIKTALISNYISGNRGAEMPEGVYVVKSTNTMTFDELIDCYMFSWIITNFHGFGWTQIYSRYLFHHDAISYHDFYFDFYQFVRNDAWLNSMYMEVETILRKSFDDGHISGNGLHYFIAEYQKQLHLNRDMIITKIELFIYKYNLPNDVKRFANEYITSWESAESKIMTFTMPVWDIINGHIPNELTEVIYEFKMNEVAATSDEYYDSFYFKRRKGWGKYAVTTINDIQFETGA